MMEVAAVAVASYGIIKMRLIIIMNVPVPQVPPCPGQVVTVGGPYQVPKNLLLPKNR